MKKEQPVTGTSGALAFLFSGGFFVNVSARLSRKDRLERRQAIFGGWSRAVMGALPHPLASARHEFAAKFPGKPAPRSLAHLRRRLARAS